MESNQLASSLRTLTSNMYKRLRKQMQTADSLSISEITTLSHLYSDSQTPSQLAAWVKVKSQSMSEVLNHLSKLDLIIKTPSVNDKRKTMVSLSDKGRQMVEQTRYERDEWLTSAIDHHLNARQKEQVAQAISLIEKLIEHQ